MTKLVLVPASTRAVYRVFVGNLGDNDIYDLSDDFEPEWTLVDINNLNWDQAVDHLRTKLLAFITDIGDDCEYCRVRAQETLDRLNTAKPGPFEAEVEGEDYLIIEEHTHDSSITPSV